MTYTAPIQYVFILNDGDREYRYERTVTDSSIMTRMQAEDSAVKSFQAQFKRDPSSVRRLA